MYPIAAIKMAGRLVDVIDDEVSQNHCVSDRLLFNQNCLK